jgi:hypothetical protein
MAIRAAEVECLRAAWATREDLLKAEVDGLNAMVETLSEDVQNLYNHNNSHTTLSAFAPRSHGPDSVPTSFMSSFHPIHPHRPQQPSYASNPADCSCPPAPPLPASPSTIAGFLLGNLAT